MSVDFCAEDFSPPCGIFCQCFMQGDQKKWSEEKNKFSHSGNYVQNQENYINKEDKRIFPLGRRNKTYKYKREKTIKQEKEGIWILKQIDSKIVVTVRKLLPKMKSFILDE